MARFKEWVTPLSTSLLWQDLGWTFYYSIHTDVTGSLLYSLWEEHTEKTKWLSIQILHSRQGKDRYHQLAHTLTEFCLLIPCNVFTGAGEITRGPKAIHVYDTAPGSPGKRIDVQRHEL